MKSEPRTSMQLSIHQRICYRIVEFETLYCINENKFCIPSELNEDQVKYNVLQGTYIALRYVENDNCINMWHVEVQEDAIRHKLIKKVHITNKVLKSLPTIMKKFLNVITESHRRCYNTRQEALKHVISMLTNLQFSENETKELLKWTTQ